MLSYYYLIMDLRELSLRIESWNRIPDDRRAQRQRGFVREYMNANPQYYSQCEEDLFLNTHFFKNKRGGLYIELGALDGVLYSNTKFFEDTLGWTGILIEPHPEKFKGLKVNRPNNFLFADLVSCNVEPLKFRYFVDQHAAVSGVEDTLTQHHFDAYFENDNAIIKSFQQATKMMTPKSLTEIVKSTGLPHIDLLSLDVEGHEYEVLKSWDFSIPIDVILIEMLGNEREKEELCRQILIQNGYIFKTIHKHNEIFVLKGSPYNL
jgi:FkbM family methyltransferase